jgi:hypothetical protein
MFASFGMGIISQAIQKVKKTKGLERIRGGASKVKTHFPCKGLQPILHGTSIS